VSCPSNTFSSNRADDQVTAHGSPTQLMTKYLTQSLLMCTNIDKEERFSSQLKHIHDIIDHTCPFLSDYCKSRPGFQVQVAYKIDTAAFSPSKKTTDNETSPSDVSKWS